MSSPKDKASPKERTGSAHSLEEGDVPQHDAAAALAAVTQAATAIDPDSDHFTDDGYSDGASSNNSMSLESGVRDYAFENGRRYHKFREGRYVFPNDESEQIREFMKHSMIVNLCAGKLHHAPIGGNPQNIIDLGTGTGVWCIDMGDEYPSAQILGVDLSPIQPEWVPPNVRFMVDDVEEPWVDQVDFYDLVHGRHITPAIKDFPTLLIRAYNHIKPGGWIEFGELETRPTCDDGSMPHNYPLSTYFRVVVEGLKNIGIDPHASREEVARLESYGFINVRHEILKAPIGPWARNKTLKTIGLYARTGITDGLQAMALGPLTRGMGWSREEVEIMLIDVRKALVDPNVHAYLPYHVFYGQKPPDAKRSP